MVILFNFISQGTEYLWTIMRIHIWIVVKNEEESWNLSLLSQLIFLKVEVETSHYIPSLILSRIII